MIPARTEPRRAIIEALQKEMAKYPQLELRTQHYFADGMYCRELFLPADAVLIGKVHKSEHFFMVTSGSIEIANEQGSGVMTAPCVVVTRPGVKRAGYCLTDVTCLTVHRTFETDLDRLEAELTEPDALSLYDSGNRIKPPLLETKA